jgi:16S rRNA (guanine527-N7)-methyltransferase
VTRLERDGFAAQLPVSRETVDRLAAYADLLERWQARINLVGPGTMGDLWRRHMLDSAQLLPHLRPGPILDLGSGAGFPGLVLAVLGAGPVHLVESDGRKCAFLREAARVTGTAVTIHPVRAETLTPFAVTTVTARALAPLSKLLELAAPFLESGARALFLKGRSSEVELTEAAKDWMMTVERIPSLSDPEGLILHLSEVQRGRQ